MKGHLLTVWCAWQTTSTTNNRLRGIVSKPPPPSTAKAFRCWRFHRLSVRAGPERPGSRIGPKQLWTKPGGRSTHLAD